MAGTLSQLSKDDLLIFDAIEARMHQKHNCEFRGWDYLVATLEILGCTEDDEKALGVFGLIFALRYHELLEALDGSR